MIRATVAALAGYLESVGVRAYDTEAGLRPDGARESAAFPYAVLAVASPVSETGSPLLGVRERLELAVTIGSHGSTPTQARWSAERVATLAGAKLNVSGRTACVESVFATPVRVDRDNPDLTVYSGADGFSVTII